MSTRQQTQTPHGSGAAPPPPVFYLQGVPYPKGDGGNPAAGGYPTDGEYPSGDGYPPPYAQQNMTHDETGVPENNSFNAPENFGFSDKTIRKYFICKVYSILMCQLLVTLLLVTMATFHTDINNYIKSHRVIGVVAVIIALGTILLFAFCVNFSRKSPTNYILLFVFTLAKSIFLTAIVPHFYQHKVLLALGLTILICFVLIIFTIQTKINFTPMSGFITVIVIILLLISIGTIFFPAKLKIFVITSCYITAFSIILIYNTRIMVNGEHKDSISPEEYIFAAITIYIDIIHIFMYILCIIGGDD